MIPKIIHLIWISYPKKNHELPTLFDKIYKYNKTINSNFKYILLTDENKEDNDYNIDKFIKKEYPDIYKIYEKTNLAVQKSDLARLVILHYYGGFYIDMDILLLKNMDDLLDYNSDKFYISYEPKEQTTYLWYSDKYLCNAFFCCNKNNDIITMMLNIIINIYNKYGDNLLSNFNVFGTNIFKIAIENSNNNLYHIIDSKLIYPVNDIKLDNLKCSLDDLKKIKTGNYDDSYMVHYWIHSNFESKKLIYSFNYNDNLDIHTNIYNFYKELYPNNKTILYDNNYINYY